MLTDAAAIGLSLVAIRLAARPAKGVMTYGLKRVEILSAQANGVTLLVLALLILFEGVRRLIDPPGVEGGLVLVVALVGVVVNLAATWMLAKREPPEPQRRGLVPAHPDRPLRVHRDGDRRRDRALDGLASAPTRSPRCSSRR